MIEGAIIGAVVGLIYAVAILLRRRGFRKELLRMLHERGPEPAHRLLEVKIKPTTRLKLSQILDQRERMAALALLGNLTALEEEIAAHTGPLTAVAQVNAIGLLGIAVRCADPTSAVSRLDALAGRVETEGGAALTLVKKKVRALAALAAGLRGAPLTSATRMTLDSFTSDGGLVALLVWQAIAQSLDQAGQTVQAEGVRGKVRALTDAFDRAQRTTG